MRNVRNIREIKGVNGSTYEVVATIDGNEYCKTFKTLEEAKKNLLNFRSNAKRKSWDYPYELVNYYFKGDDVDIAYIENNFDENLKVVLSTILPREEKILLMYFKDGFTLEGIARQEGVTRERIRQILDKALRRINHPARLRILRYGKEICSLQDNIAKMTLELQAKAECLLKENPSDYKPLDCDIETLELSLRSYNCLKRANIKTVRQLLSLKNDDLFKIRNLGLKSFKEIKSKLKGYSSPIPYEPHENENEDISLCE